LKDINEQKLPEDSEILKNSNNQTTKICDEIHFSDQNIVNDDNNADENSNKILFLKGTDEITFKVRINLSKSSKEIKNKISIKKNITNDQIRLIYKGNLMHNDQSIESYGIKGGDVIH
jgi:uncharacterized ubiquitin-like protein YukD